MIQTARKDGRKMQARDIQNGTPSNSSGFSEAKSNLRVDTWFVYEIAQWVIPVGIWGCPKESQGQGWTARIPPQPSEGEALLRRRSSCDRYVCGVVFGSQGQTLCSACHPLSGQWTRSHPSSNLSRAIQYLHDAKKRGVALPTAMMLDDYRPSSG